MRSLIHKFLAGEISNTELDKLKLWLTESASNRRIFDNENEIWQESGIKTKHDFFQTDKSWGHISKKLELGKRKTSPAVILNKRIFTLIIAAASITLIVAIGSITLGHIERQFLGISGKLTNRIQTHEGEKTHILLPDSTSVVLNSGTTIQYSGDYNFKERVVNLTGEAYFDVHKDSERPFLVRIGKISITATGTRFNVLFYSNEDRIETTLEEGSIKIDIPGKEPIGVKPGQQLIYFTKTNMSVLNDVTSDIYTSWKENKLRLKDTPIEEAFRRIARRYNVVFEIRNHELLELKYTATFIDESIEDVMQMLGAVSPIKYKIINRTSVDDKKYIKPKIIVEKTKFPLRNN